MPNNNTYISSKEPISEDPRSPVFSRVWFRFFDAVGRKLRILDGSVSTSATAGGATVLPAAPDGYMTIVIDGVNKKVPYYNE